MHIDIFFRAYLGRCVYTYIYIHRYTPSPVCSCIYLCIQDDDKMLTCASVCMYAYTYRQGI